jgi:hypothetical protein
MKLCHNARGVHPAQGIYFGASDRLPVRDERQCLECCAREPSFPFEPQETSHLCRKSRRRRKMGRPLMPNDHPSTPSLSVHLVQRSADILFGDSGRVGKIS